MGGGPPLNKVRHSSVLRRLPPFDRVFYEPRNGNVGDVCAFELSADAERALLIESASGRMMTLPPGGIFLGTPGFRAATRSVAGHVPQEGLIPDHHYWVLADCGVVGELAEGSPAESYIWSVRYLGLITPPANIRDYAIAQIRIRDSLQNRLFAGAADHGSPLYLVLGTSGNVGKTTAGQALLRSLQMQGHPSVVVFKATGTGSIEELASYHDFGAAVFDCVDFGVPATYPITNPDVVAAIHAGLDYCLSLTTDAVIVEAGGEFGIGANTVLIAAIKERRRDVTIILVAADALGALGAQRALAKLELTPSLITGPCTDTEVLRARTEQLTGVTALNLSGRGSWCVPPT